MRTLINFLSEWLKNILRNSWPWIVVLVVLVGLLIASRRKYESIKQDKERLSVEFSHAQIDPLIVHDTIRDSVPISTTPVVLMEKSTYKKDIADRQLLKDMGLGTGQIESQQTAGSSYTDTVRMTETREAVLHYSDRWTDLTLSMKPPDTTLVYSVRDSVVTFVYREYKHRFLWWKWGTKGYKVKVVNFNPHATIRYNEYIKVE